nr:matrixin family metalloprotease [uncultured Flavobacterium sp.]
MTKKLIFLVGIITLCLVSLSCSREDAKPNEEAINMCTTDIWNDSILSTSKTDAVIIDNPRWKVGQTIKIKFLDGTPDEQEIVKKYAAQWTAYANLNFEFVPKEEDTHIRIAFNMGKPGAWSTLGSSQLLQSPTYLTYQNTPSMRLGPVSDDRSSRRTILHEFGHALGLKHETTNPSSTIKWNLPKVYSYYEDLMGMSKDEVDSKIIGKPNVNDYSPYDPLSIMHYYVPASLTLDGVSVAEQSELSETDKVSINKYYPFPIVSEMKSGQSFNELPWKDRIKSPNGRYALEFVPGLLHIRDLTENKIIWEVGDSAYQRKPSCFFESNGNITLKGAVTSAAQTKILWTSNTSEYSGATLQLKDDGELQLVYNGVVKWSSKTGKSK